MLESYMERVREEIESSVSQKIFFGWEEDIFRMWKIYSYGN